jgi:hypothetical protein
MALLVIDLDRRIGNQQVWRDTFADQLQDLEVRFWPDAGASADIEYLAFIRPNFDLLPDFPKLKAMFSRTAGAEEFINHPRLPGCRSAKSSRIRNAPAGHSARSSMRHCAGGWKPAHNRPATGLQGNSPRSW